MDWMVPITVCFVIIFTGLFSASMYEIGKYHDSNAELKKLNSKKDLLRAPDIHDSEKQNNTEPDIHDSEKQNNTEPDIHDSEKQNNTEPDIHDSEKQNNTEPDIHDSEKQNNTKKSEFERIVLEIEEQELSRDKHHAAFVAYILAAFVGTPFVLLCLHIIVESVRHPSIDECVKACPVLSFLKSQFCPLSQEDDDIAQEDNDIARPDSAIARILRVLSPDNAQISVVFRRFSRPSRVLSIPAELPGVPSTSNDSER